MSEKRRRTDSGVSRIFFYKKASKLLLELENKPPSIEDRGQTDRRVAVVANPTPITPNLDLYDHLIISLLLHPAAVLLSSNVLVFAILETFVVLSVSLLLCMSII